MKRILFAAALFASFAAMATPPGNNGGGNGGCGVGQQTNGCGGSTTPGNRGQGGVGGSAAALAAAQARADAQANAIAAQQQAQQQGQAQTSRNTNKNTNTVKSNVTTGAVNVSVSLPAAATTSDKAGTPAETVKEPATAQKSDTLVVDNDNKRYPVSTAYAAPLTSSPETCMGSSSGGVQGASFGVSVGTTWESVKCDRRMNARTLDALGKRAAAVALMCKDAEVREAMKAAETPCPGTDGKRAEAILNGEAISQRTPMPWQAGG